LKRGRTAGSTGIHPGRVGSVIESKTQQRTFVGSSVGSAVDDASIVGSFGTLEAWKNHWLSWIPYGTRGLCNLIEDSTAYIRWLF
jgi:hypothetical protein